MNLLVVGMNHNSAPLELRERFAVADPRAPLEKLARSPEVEEAVLLSTCNRVEVVLLTRDLAAARLRARHLFARELTAEPPAEHELQSALYEHVDGAAVRHVFRVACSVDSLVVGEPQIAGQVKDAYRAAVECGACGPILGRLHQRAFSTAKRVRNETRIAERPVSVARVAVDLARQIFETLEDKSALLIGAGEMIEMALRALRDRGLRQIAVANRTAERASDLAARFDASAWSLDDLPQILPRSDVVLTSIGGDAPVLTGAMLRDALRERRERAIFVIDIGVPRNVSPEVDELDNVYRYDLDDLTAVASDNADERRHEVEHAEEIVREEEQRFDGWLAALGAVPTIRDLVARGEAVREAELARVVGRLGLSDEQLAGVEQLTRGIVNKLLHTPLSRLRAEGDREEGLATLEAARMLFGLDEAGERDDEDGSR